MTLLLPPLPHSKLSSRRRPSYADWLLLPCRAVGVQYETKLPAEGKSPYYDSMASLLLCCCHHHPLPSSTTTSNFGILDVFVAAAKRIPDGYWIRCQKWRFCGAQYHASPWLPMSAIHPNSFSHSGSRQSVRRRRRGSSWMETSCYLLVLFIASEFANGLLLSLPYSMLLLSSLTR